MRPEGPRPAADNRASSNMQLAAAMLRRGGDLPTIAAVTDVPVPLLDLMVEEQRTSPQRRRRLDGSAVTLGLLLALVAVDLLTFCSVTVCVIAMLLQQPNIGIIAGVVTLTLLGLSWSLICRGRRHGPDR